MKRLKKLVIITVVILGVIFINNKPLYKAIKVQKFKKELKDVAFVKDSVVFENREGPQILGETKNFHFRLGEYTLYNSTSDTSKTEQLYNGACWRKDRDNPKECELSDTFIKNFLKKRQRPSSSMVASFYKRVLNEKS